MKDRILFKIFTFCSCALKVCAIESFVDTDKIIQLPGYEGISKDINYAGYSIIDQNKKMFYWFFGSEDYDQRPTLLWSNGGPGASSLWGFFLENGPYIISKDSLELKKRNNSWGDTFNYLIFEHPLSVTLSFAEDKYLPSNVEEGVLDLYNALIVFLKKHPEIARQPLILAGQSYAATYLPILADLILEGNKNKIHDIKISKIILISPWIDPCFQMGFNTTYAFTHGLISEKQKKELDEEYKGKKIELIGEEIEKLSQLKRANISNQIEPSFKPILDYINNPIVRQKLKIDSDCPKVKSDFSEKIEKNYAPTVNTSYLYLIQKFLDETNVTFLFVSGLDDARDTNFLGVEACLNKLKGPKANSYFESEQKPWIDEKSLKVVGFQKESLFIKYLKVLNAGHNAASEQPLIIEKIKSQ
jgi:vitellogenic carboxypeptidase-like protein